MDAGHGIGSTMDIFPTVAKLCGGAPSGNPLDGIDIWPMLSGQKPEMEREALLYFDDVHLQCARLGKYKLHISRYNSVTYSPAPAAGRLNLPLKSPELYDLIADPDESYDVSAQHPGVVADIQARVERLMAGFPDGIRKAYSETKARKTWTSATGAVTR
jgi:arylsulfatase A-like enzyme